MLLQLKIFLFISSNLANISLIDFRLEAPIKIIFIDTNKTPASSNNSFVKPVVKSAIEKKIKVNTIVIVLPICNLFFNFFYFFRFLIQRYKVKIFMIVQNENFSIISILS